MRRLRDRLLRSRISTHQLLRCIFSARIAGLLYASAPEAAPFASSSSTAFVLNSHTDWRYLVIRSTGRCAKRARGRSMLASTIHPSRRFPTAQGPLQDYGMETPSMNTSGALSRRNHDHRAGHRTLRTCHTSMRCVIAAVGLTLLCR